MKPAATIRGLRPVIRGVIGGRDRVPRLLIVSLGRSGTELLVGLLDSHSRIRCESEVLARPTRFPVAFLEGRAATAASTGARAYGAKVLRHHFARYPHAGRPLLEKLVARGFLVVVVRRRNILRQALSHHRAHRSGTFHLREDGDERSAVRFSPEPEEVVAWLLGVERDGAALDRLVDGVACLELWYEDDLGTPDAQQATIDRICEVVGVEPAPVTSPLRRASRESLAGSFVNASEVQAHLQTTRFAHLWDDEE